MRPPKAQSPAESPKAPAPWPAGQSLGLAALGAVVFLAAFVWSAWRAYSIRVVRHEPVPDLTALVNGPQSNRLIPISDFLLHEGSWDWPRGGRFFVLPDAVGGLPPKSLAATKEAVERANADGADPPWAWAGEGRNVARGYQLAAAAAWVGDWWRLQMRHALGWQTNRFALRPQQGLSPTAVAALYESHAAQSPKDFPLSRPQRLDPVCRRPYPCSLSAMARLFELAAQARPTSSTLFQVRSAGWPSGGETVRFEEFAMAQPPRQILPSRRITTEAEANAASQALAQALHSYGILLAGLAEGAWTEGGDCAVETLFVEQAAVLMGCYEKDGNRLFLLRSPTGFPTDKGRAPSPLTLAPPEALAGAWAFPHPFRAVWTREGQGLTRLLVTDPEGKPLPMGFPEDLGLEFNGAVWEGSAGELWIAPSASADRGGLEISLSRRFFMPTTEIQRLWLEPPE